jgi:electron transfer flavoprotein alpha subunit
MAVLVLAEHDNKTLKPSTLSVIGAAKKLGGEIHVLVAGAGCGAVSDAAAKCEGVAKVLNADNSPLEHQLAEDIAPLLHEQGKNYSHILAPATTHGKNVLPRAAALLDVLNRFPMSSPFTTPRHSTGLFTRAMRLRR